MEVRRLLLLSSIFVLVFVSQCSESRHAVKRETNDYDNSEEMLNDESSDYAQNDADGGDEDEEAVVEDATIVSKGDSYRLLIGKSVRLECKVSPSEKTVVMWSKDNEKLFISKTQLNPNKRISLVENSSDLLIKYLELSDTGRYSCEIVQKKPVSIVHVVIVEEPPRITKFSASDNGILREGSDLLLTCDVTGTPQPSIIWSRQKEFGFGGTEPLGEANGEFSGKTFFMKNVNKSDSGTYYCYAVSDAGNATASLNVAVYGKPRVHVHRPVINTDIGVEAVLQCSAHEEQAPRFKWYKDGQMIEDSVVGYSLSTDGPHSNLTITPQRDEDFGKYTCEAENPHGRHNKSIDLVQSPVIEDLDVDGPKLSWTVHSHQPLEDIEVQLRQLSEDGEWRSLKVPLPDTKENTHKYEIIYAIDEKDLKAGEYQAIVKVKNNKSWSEHSDPAMVQLVFRGSNDGAFAIQPTSTLIATILMYLLVRML